MRGIRIKLVYSTNRLENFRCLTRMTPASELGPADERSFKSSILQDGKWRRSDEGDTSLRRGQAPKKPVTQAGESQLPRGQEVAVRDVPARGKPHVRALCCFKKMPAGKPLPVTAQVQLPFFHHASRICALHLFIYFGLISSWITAFKNGANIHGRSYEE
ncbi:hypothetical protein CABS01_02969 [Colletotrichum abscissum]|uniref:uncharacterized protein n=1 Tax=Colletotrichum abscissum TaxID=1671311 RepID=UPI0027D6A6F8|nr:uncharacterized protein CABS01_02969 [Colletotrichum abscissum]KAK1483233.1 hypothetical protein CABS01_02969 [Colletotrichum abscissum]